MTRDFTREAEAFVSNDAGDINIRACKLKPDVIGVVILHALAVQVEECGTLEH